MFYLRMLGSALLALAAASCASTRNHVSSDVDPSVIRIAESHLDPICDRPLRAYDRYYALVHSEGRDLIVGHFVVRPIFSLRRLRSSPITGTRGAFVTSEEDLPACGDDLWRGCDIVQLTLDPRTGEIVPFEPVQEPVVVDGRVVEQLALTTVCFSIA